MTILRTKNTEGKAIGLVVGRRLEGHAGPSGEVRQAEGPAGPQRLLHERVPVRTSLPAKKVIAWWRLPAHCCDRGKAISR